MLVKVVQGWIYWELIIPGIGEIRPEIPGLEAENVQIVHGNPRQLFGEGNPLGRMWKLVFAYFIRKR